MVKGLFSRKPMNSRIADCLHVAFGLICMASSTSFGIQFESGRTGRLSDETPRLAMDSFRQLRPHIENNEPLTAKARANRSRFGFRVSPVGSTEAIEGLALQKRRCRLQRCNDGCRDSARTLARRSRATVPYSNSVRSLPPDLMTLLTKAPRLTAMPSNWFIAEATRARMQAGRPSRRRASPTGPSRRPRPPSRREGPALGKSRVGILLRSSLSY